MQALLSIKLPFDISIPIDAELKPYETEKPGLRIVHEPPRQSETLRALTQAEQITVNGVLSRRFDVLVIRLFAEDFERSETSSLSPDLEAILNSEINFFLSRLKFVTNADKIKPIEFPRCAWELRYLNDAGQELPPAEGKVRGRGILRGRWSYIACTTEVWDKVFTLPSEFRVPSWQPLLADASGALPHVGTSIVLAATALEVFISELLNVLVGRSGLPQEFWDWVNSRGSLKDPSIDEEFDFLLHFLAGHSLKDDEPKLWQARKNLATARNTFVHQGQPVLGGAEVDVEGAGKLISTVHEIIAKVREWIPEDLRWPKMDFKMDIQILVAVVVDRPPEDKPKAIASDIASSETRDEKGDRGN
jgi:hypothetical protein